MQKWEYLSIALLTPDRPIEGTLDDYGEDGWELVAIVPLHAEQEVLIGDYVTHYAAVFKRPLT